MKYSLIAFFFSVDEPSRRADLYPSGFRRAKEHDNALPSLLAKGDPRQVLEGVGYPGAAAMNTGHVVGDSRPTKLRVAQPSEFAPLVLPIAQVGKRGQNKKGN